MHAEISRLQQNSPCETDSHPKSLKTTNFNGLWTDSIPQFSVYLDINISFKLAHFLTEYYLNKTRFDKTLEQQQDPLCKFSPQICLILLGSLIYILN